MLRRWKVVKQTFSTSCTEFMAKSGAHASSVGGSPLAHVWSEFTLNIEELGLRNGKVRLSHATWPVCVLQPFFSYCSFPNTTPSNLSSLSQTHDLMSIASETTIQSTAAFLKDKLPEHFQSVKLGVICGSGLGGLVDTIDQSSKVEFAYKDVPGFAVSTGMNQNPC